MGESNTQICRLCLTITPSCESKPIEDVKKENLKVLPNNIDFYTSISGDAVTCKRCLKTLQDWLDFKTRCSNMDVDFKTATKKKSLPLTSFGRMCRKSSRGCWLCTSLTEVKAFNYATERKEGVLLKDMIRNCFPNVHLEAGPAILLCQPCLSSMKKYYKFIKSSQEVEQRTKHFRQLSPQVILEDVLKFKEYNVPDKPPTIKKEGLDAKNFDEKAMKCLENAGPASIKCEEIDIKDEIEEGATASASHQSDNPDSFEEVGLSTTTTKGKNHVCPTCTYSTKNSCNFRRHLSTHADGKWYRCIVCSFVTDAKLFLADHMTTHRGATKEYGCPECPYETDHKNHLAGHIVKHKDASDVKMYKCPSCPLECRYKSAWVKHQKLQHSKNVKIYKCQGCSFSTKYRYGLSRHQLLHEDPEGVRKLKCEKCPFRSKWKGALYMHMKIHKKLHCCDQCKYYTERDDELLEHQLVYQEERQTYKCKLCRFQTRYFGFIKSHMMRAHTGPSLMSKFKCLHCHYETNEKRKLSIHLKRCHRKRTEHLFNCDLCKFSTGEESRLKQHQLRHSKLGEAMWYYCATCNFKSLYKNSLTYHMKCCAKRKRGADDQKKK